MWNHFSDNENALGSISFILMQSFVAICWLLMTLVITRDHPESRGLLEWPATDISKSIVILCPKLDCTPAVNAGLVQLRGIIRSAITTTMCVYLVVPGLSTNLFQELHIVIFYDSY